MRPSEIVERAQIALRAGDYDNAARLAGHVLGSFGRHAGARLVRALVAEANGDTERALDDLSFVASAEPADAQVRAAQARAFRRAGDEARAREFAQQTVELVPTAPDVIESALDVLGVDADALAPSLAVLARIHLNSNWPHLAEREARQALTDHPERVDIRLTLAEALWRQERLAECEEQCKVVFDQANDCVRAAVMLAHILSERGRTAEGQDLLERVGEIDPEFLEARRMLGSLEVHRLVLPEPPELQPPADLGEADSTHVSPPEPVATAAEPPARPNGDAAMPDGRPGGSSAATDGTGQGADPAADVPTVHDAAGETHPVPGADGNSHGPSLGGPDVTGPAPEPADQMDAKPAAAAADELAPDTPGDSGPQPDRPDPTAAPAQTESHDASDPEGRGALTELDWARELMRRERWAEAEQVLAEIATNGDFRSAEVDELLEAAADHAALRIAVLRLLGDYRMRTSRPQAAAEAYLRAADERSAAGE